MFFRELEEKLEALQTDDIIICGDWNVTIDHKLDNKNYVSERSKRGREAVNQLIENQSMVDIYRAVHGNKEAFTWYNPSGPQIARLDFALINASLQQAVDMIDIELEYCSSDHKVITMVLDYDKFKKGKGVWRHPDQLLQEPEYVRGINRVIDETLANNVLDDQNQHRFLDNQSPKYS